jgi:hypothetical protein
VVHAIGAGEAAALVPNSSLSIRVGVNAPQLITW